MFTLDTTIDAVQSAKKQFVKTFVTNETIATAMNEFVDALNELYYIAFFLKKEFDSTFI